MSKFFISNSDFLFDRIKKEVESSPYKSSFESIKDGVYALSTQKLVVDNVNGTKCDDGFIIVTGTMAWGSGDSINLSSLKEIHSSFKGDVNAIRANSIGNYAVSLFKDKSLYVFGETIGFYNIYFYHIAGEWLISNSLYDMAIVLRDRITINKLAVIEATVQDGLLLGDTYYNEINRLSGFNYIRVSKSVFEVIEEEIGYPMANGTLNEKVDRYTELMRDYGVKMSSAYGAPVISMTGGLDARMVMSSYLATGIKPCLYYGTGNSFITNTYNEDREIDKLFSEKYGLTFFDESWSTPKPFDKYWDKYLNLYGYYYDTYAASEDVLDSIKNNPCKLFTYGYCGELLRNLPWIEARENDFFTLNEYIEEFYVPEAVERAVVDIDNYKAYIRRKLEVICQQYHLDIKHIANEDIFFLSLERRKSADAHMVNLVNFMKYCCYTIGEYESLKAARVTCSEAANSGFMLRCLDTLYPSVLDVPVFSHCTIRKFYRETMSLNPQNQPYSKTEKLIGFLRNNVHWLWLLARKVFPRKKWRYSVDATIYEHLMLLIEKCDEHKVIYPNKLDDTRRIINYAMKEYAIRHINNLKCF